RAGRSGRSSTGRSCLELVAQESVPQMVLPTHAAPELPAEASLEHVADPFKCARAGHVLGIDARLQPVETEDPKSDVGRAPDRFSSVTLSPQVALADEIADVAVRVMGVDRADPDVPDVPAGRSLDDGKQITVLRGARARDELHDRLERLRRPARLQVSVHRSVVEPLEIPLVAVIRADQAERDPPARELVGIGD